MILFLLATMATAQPASPPAPAAMPAAGDMRDVVCNSRLTRTREVWRRRFDPRANGPRKLGELPPGYAILAVDRRVDGCPVNVLPARDANGQHRMEWAPSAGVHAAPARR
jgi:hypothetical protein